MPATVLVLVETINDYLPILERQGFHLILAPTPAERAEAISRHSGQIDAVLARWACTAMKSPPCPTSRSSA
jgi:hypothetical protein